MREFQKAWGVETVLHLGVAIMEVVLVLAWVPDLALVLVFRRENMRVDFEDGGFLEFSRSRKPHHVFVIVASRKLNELQLIVNSAEVHVSKLHEIFLDVSGPIIQENNNEKDNPRKDSGNQ
jgi:hypothetical protein